MQQLKNLLTFFLLVFAFSSCEKETTKMENPNTLPSKKNKPPFANAGGDQTILLPINTTTLDGSGSTDPDNNIAKYTWALISGPSSSNISNLYAAKTQITNLVQGVYQIELMVIDSDNLSAKDTIQIIVKPVLTSSSNQNDVNKTEVDITINQTYLFIKNYNNPWDYGAPNPENYYDFTTIEGKSTILPLGEFNIYIYEYADTAALSNVHNTYIQISQGQINALSVFGNCSINFKKLIKEGGGSFSGIFTVTSGSWNCYPNGTNLPQLTVSGSLDVATQIVNLRIKGKVCF